MPRRKQSNPQPVKLGPEDAVGVENPESLVLESDFLLEQDFGENDYKIIGFERDSDSVTADMGIPAYAFSDEDCSSYNRLSMESDFEDPRDTESEREDMGGDSAFAPYLSCRQCGQLLGDPLSGALDVAGLYCLQCGGEERGAEQKHDQGKEGSAQGAQQKGHRAKSTTNSYKSYSCKLCSFTSRYSNHLKRHMKTHNGEKPYQCQHCTYASSQLVNLQRHVRTHTGEKPYKCDYCTFACNSLGNLKRHRRMHTQEKPNKCSQCDYRASSSHTLKRHMMVHKTDASTAVMEESVESDLSLHISADPDFLQSIGSLHADHHPPSLLEAEALGQETEPMAELLFPFTCRVCGLALEEEEEAEAMHICNKCTLDMLAKSSPSSPEKGDKLFSCTSCPFITQYPNHLVRHMKTHSGEKPYKCPQCNYASAHFDNLKRHHRVHTGEKPYKCHLCDYACGNLANLKRHERIHSGAKPFQCTVCSYSCNQSMNLKRHMLRHTGEKPFKCQECAYTTGHWDNYKRHQKKHGHASEGWMKLPLPEKEEEEEEEEEEEGEM